MITKSSDVRVKTIAPELLFGLLVLESIFSKSADWPAHELVITSINDGEHMPGSLHYVGRAADIRTHGLEEVTINLIVSKAKTALGKDFDIIYEQKPDGASHIHLEYDPK